MENINPFGKLLNEVRGDIIACLNRRPHELAPSKDRMASYLRKSCVIAGPDPPDGWSARELHPRLCWLACEQVLQKEYRCRGEVECYQALSRLVVSLEGDLDTIDDDALCEWQGFFAKVSAVLLRAKGARIRGCLALVA